MRLWPFRKRQVRVIRIHDRADLLMMLLDPTIPDSIKAQIQERCAELGISIGPSDADEAWLDSQ